MDDCSAAHDLLDGQRQGMPAITNSMSQIFKVLMSLQRSCSMHLKPAEQDETEKLAPDASQQNQGGPSISRCSAWQLPAARTDL